MEGFLKAALTYNLKINQEKSLRSINVLGYKICDGTLQPDPEHLRPLLQMPPSSDSKQLKRCIGMFAYYAKWIFNYSSKICPLVENKQFPMPFKKDIAESSIKVIDNELLFVIETDASEKAIGDTLLQAGRPVVFFSRLLNLSKTWLHIVKKKAYAIVECVCKWRDLIAGKLFTIITDQQAYFLIMKKLKMIKLCGGKWSFFPFHMI